MHSRPDTKAGAAEEPSKSEPVPVSAQPQQTSASFDDWIARGQRIGEPGKNICEAAQSLVVKGQSAPVAQIALGQVEKLTTITFLVPTNIAFDKPPRSGRMRSTWSRSSSAAVFRADALRMQRLRGRVRLMQICLCRNETAARPMFRG